MLSSVLNAAFGGVDSTVKTGVLRIGGSARAADWSSVLGRCSDTETVLARRCLCSGGHVIIVQVQLANKIKKGCRTKKRNINPA
jgi:hypothetical protein